MGVQRCCGFAATSSEREILAIWQGRYSIDTSHDGMTSHSLPYGHTVGGHRYGLRSLTEVMAKATAARSGDRLAGVIAHSAKERVAAQVVLAELPLKAFLNDVLIPYEDDDITRLIIDTHNVEAFAVISHLTVGDFRDWLLSDLATSDVLAGVRSGITPEMAAAVCKLMRNQDLILVAKKCEVVTAFRNTIGLPGRLSTRLQPNHPTDDRSGGYAAIGITPRASIEGQ